MMTLEWQPFSTRLGYDIPAEIEAHGYSDQWMSLMDDAGELYEALRLDVGLDVAQYVVPFAFNVRFVMEMNPRQASHLIELRSQPAGHPAYREVAHQMHKAIRDVAGHEVVAEMMKFVDYTDVDLERLESERRAEKKREAARANR